jgi:hypothetical protein
MERITDKAIREHLGHNGNECRVRIQRDGIVLRNGSPDHADRGKDEWLYIGRRSDIVRSMTADAD